ncbi:MAG TPA: high-affinity nickel-transport family protein [Polyangiaceae bacterium]|nr:high-affinity nickel-transport family protein [Polyangiaceae bacterium]
MTLLAILVLGFFLGMRHATDADHVVAVSTMVSRERRPKAALLMGALWGIGHSLTILVVGGAIILFGLVVPPRLGLSMEMSVAVMLIVLGAMNLSGTLGHMSDLAKDKSQAIAQEEPLRASSMRTPGWLIRPLVVGIVHGLAGSAGIALLVLATIRAAGWAMLYLALFGLGTVVGMMTLTMAMSLPVVLAPQRFTPNERLLAKVTGIASVTFGLFLAYRVGFVDGLFLSVPSLEPK